MSPERLLRKAEEYAQGGEVEKTENTLKGYFEFGGKDHKKVREILIECYRRALEKEDKLINNYFGDPGLRSLPITPTAPTGRLPEYTEKLELVRKREYDIMEILGNRKA